MGLDPASLDDAWRATFELAWEAWRSGTIPIGAVVTDSSGNQIGAGRNRIFDHEAPAGQIAGSWLAHAEVNALLQLPPGGHYAGVTVTTTTEPCLLCTGAIIMSLRGTVLVRYAATDPIAGGLDLAPLSPQGRRRDVRVQRLDHSEFVTFADALNLAESIRRAPEGIVATDYKKRRPELFACATELERALRPFLHSDTPFDHALDTINAVLRNHPQHVDCDVLGGKRPS